jgi:hypothetical protein
MKNKRRLGALVLRECDSLLSDDDPPVLEKGPVILEPLHRVLGVANRVLFVGSRFHDNSFLKESSEAVCFNHDDDTDYGDSSEDAAYNKFSIRKRVKSRFCPKPFYPHRELYRLHDYYVSGVSEVPWKLMLELS